MSDLIACRVKSFSTFNGYLLSSVVRLSFHHNCHIWRHLPRAPSPQPPLLSNAKEGIASPVAVLWSTLIRRLILLSSSKLLQILSSAEIFGGLQRGKKALSFSFCWRSHWKWLNMLMYTPHYPIMGGGSVAIDWVWQLHPWLTGVIRRIGLTDKMADKARDKLSNQKLYEEWALSTLRGTVRW